MSIEKFFTDQYYKQANLIWLLAPLSLINYFIYYLRNALYRFNIFKQKKCNSDLNVDRVNFVSG